MDSSHFDRMSRALGAATSRRAGIAAALGALFGGAAIGAAAGPKAGKGPGKSGPCGNGSNKDNKCKKDGECCTKYCADGFCRCKPNWTPCTKSAHCCSGSCILGQCDGGCNPEGSRCKEDFNCCTGMVCGDGRCVKSNKAKCSKKNCSGCCDGTTCRPGGAAIACGKKGGACSKCRGSETCANGTCGTGGSCSAANCTSGGCCNGTSCVAVGAMTDSLCGTATDGAACVVCSGGEICTDCVCSAPCNRTVGATLGGVVTDTTIQSAIDAAPAGGQVCIQAGTYTTNTGSYFGTITKNLTIEGADEATTILDGQTTRSGFEIGTDDYTSAITVTISNLTIQNSGGGDGGGVYAWGNTGMTVDMTDVTVKNGTGVTGIYMDGNNYGTGPAFTGIRVTSDGNDIRPNNGRGGGFITYGIATLTDCEITNNSVKSEGGGITIVGGGSITMTGGKLSGNHAYPNVSAPGYGNGGAFSFVADSVQPVSILLTNVEIKNNVADGSGGVGYYQGDSTVTMTNCTVTGNTGATCNCVYHFDSLNSTYVCDTSYCSA
jgi:hypothetical protein